MRGFVHLSRATRPFIKAPGLSEVTLAHQLHDLVPCQVCGLLCWFRMGNDMSLLMYLGC